MPPAAVAPQSNGHSYRGAVCIHEAFEATAAASPVAVAVVCEQEYVTYAELNARANRLAHYLISLGVRTGSRVALCLERSIEVIVALLAVLKTGAAYVPLESAYPRERLVRILADADPSVLICDGVQAAKLEFDLEKFVDLHRHAARINDQGTTNPNASVVAEDLAYIMYTSGTSGTPKGVKIEHRTVANLLSSAQRLFNFTRADVWVCVHSYAFDVSGWEIWGCLLSGGRLVVAPERVTNAPDKLYQLLIRERVTVLNETPSAARQLTYVRRTAERSLRPPSSLRIVICGGESLPGTVASDLLDWQVPVWNVYGPTEATIWATAFRVCSEDCRDAVVSIGLPFEHVCVKVCDHEQREVGVGTAGEIYIGGECLARGYNRRPELDASRFVRVGANAERFYRTGDWARRRADGNLEFLGRIDEQVKINGFRVELSEIEAALERHSAIREAVVTLDNTSDGIARLVAYVVAGGCTRPSASELRAALSRLLPNYMVPSAFLWVDRIPLTVNGKVDRAALRPVTGFETRPQRSIVNADPLQEQVRKIWERVLRSQPIGIHDNFFELGGHSLLAVQLFTEIEKDCGKTLPLATLIGNPTVAELTTAIRQEASCCGMASCVVPIQDRGNATPFFCVHALGGNVLNYFDLSRRLGETRPFYAFQAVGLNPCTEPDRTIAAMAARYVAAMCSCQPQGPYFIGGESFGGIVAYEMAQQLRRRGEEVGLLVLLDAHSEAEPLNTWRRKIFRRIELLYRLPLRERASYVKNEFRHLPASIRTKLRRNATAQAVPLPPLFDIVRKVNAGAHASYNFRPYGGEVALFRARESLWSDDMGWRRFITGTLIVREVPGTHETFINAPHATFLARALEAELRSAEQRVARRQRATVADSVVAFTSIRACVVGSLGLLLPLGASAAWIA